MYTFHFGTIYTFRFIHIMLDSENRTSFSNPKLLNSKMTIEHYIKLNHIYNTVCIQNKPGTYAFINNIIYIRYIIYI